MHSNPSKIPARTHRCPYLMFVSPVDPNELVSERNRWCV